MLERPAWLFDRDREWSLLEGALGGRAGTRLAVVYGRRRQGKTALTRAWCDAAAGFHWEAAEVEAAQNLEALGLAWSQFVGSDGQVRFASWDDAIKHLCSAGAAIGAETPIPVVLDEFNRIVERVPEVASYIQRAIAPGTPAYLKGKTRLTLCGSAFGAMRRLLDGPAALRGRSSMELVVEPFDFRTAADFWGLRGNPSVAFRLHALIGGTPAYLELANDDTPADGDLDSWVIRRLLDPSSALYREGRIVVAEDAAVGDAQLYWGLLAAIADGQNRWVQLERVLGGSRGSLKHVMDVATDAGWVRRNEDPLRTNRSTYELTEPMIRFHRLVVDPSSSRIAARHRADLVWNDLRNVVSSQIYGPHFETMSRDWVQRFADPSTVGGVVDAVGTTVIDRHQVDVAVTVKASKGRSVLAAIGEVKATVEPVGVDQIDRLDAVVTTLADRVVTNGSVRRLLFSQAGFTADLVRAAAKRGDVELIDLHRLYSGS
jgi:uncharacterized protein